MASTLVNPSDVLNTAQYKQDFTYTNETGAFNDSTGRWEPVTSAALPASGSIQPVIRTEFHELLEWAGGGARIVSAILIFTQSDLIAAENGDPTSGTGSTVTHDGLKWKVIDIQDYSAHGHKEVIAVRIDAQNG